MPYLSCPTCSLTVYTAERLDACPRCRGRVGGHDLAARETPRLPTSAGDARKPGSHRRPRAS